uniref:C-type lectin domain-containing protein n=1 Tax=Acrobeloides nanus TaxID=290746 RepID=A0A914CHG7_9BILA
MNWVDAENYCANFTYKIVFVNAGNLVTVWSAFLNNDFGGVAKNLTMGNMSEWWIGLSTNNFGNFGEWMWSDGSPFSYSNFAKGQTCNKGDNNCCVTATLPNFQWNIRNCNGSIYPFMCQLVGP